MNRGEMTMAQNIEKGIVNVLVSLGFENVCAVMSNDTLKLTYENNIYRWNVRGLRVVIDTVMNRVPHCTKLEIITQKNGIPLFKTTIREKDWLMFRNDSITEKEFVDRLQLTNSTDETWKSLSDQPKSNPHYKKFDLMVYPLLRIMNIYFYHIYEVQFNLCPTLEFSLWKGNKCTGQVIVPLYSDIAYSYGYVHAGFITISQEFRFSKHFFNRVTLGNFDRNRYGLDYEIQHPFKNPHFSAGLQCGVTGWNTIHNGLMIFVSDFSIYGLANLGYYFNPFYLQIDLKGGRFLYGDYGARVDVTRYFGDTSIGFYATYSGGKNDAGFHFTAPFPPGKRSRRHHFRVLPSNYYYFEYSGGTEFVNGKTYNPAPDQNRSENNFNMLYIKNSLY